MSGSSPAAERAADGSRFSIPHSPFPSPQSRLSAIRYPLSAPAPNPDLAPNPNPNPNPNPDPDPDPDPDPIPHSPLPIPEPRVSSPDSPAPNSPLPIPLPIYAIMRKDILQKDTFRKMGCSV